jgi:ATP-dependent RNA helicase DDX35
VIIGLRSFEFRIRRKRPSLRVIVSSATLDASAFLDYFTSSVSDDAAIVSLEGRMYPVDIAYLRESTADYVRKAVEVAWSINLQVLNFSHQLETALLNET